MDYWARFTTDLSLTFALTLARSLALARSLVRLSASYNRVLCRPMVTRVEYFSDHAGTRYIYFMSLASPVLLCIAVNIKRWKSYTASFPLSLFFSFCLCFFFAFSLFIFLPLSHRRSYVLLLLFRNLRHKCYFPVMHATALNPPNRVMDSFSRHRK